MNCQDQIYSEEYIDFIGNRSLIESKYTLDCKQPLGARFASLYLKLSDGYEDGTVYGYYNTPGGKKSLALCKFTINNPFVPG